jgi:hypothetical protein
MTNKVLLKKTYRQKIGQLNHSPFASKLFLIIFALLLIGSISLTFWRIVVKRDYIISAEQECDPYTEACFIYTCSPDEDEECPADPAERMSYYKLIHKNAQNIPLCDAQADECPAELTCAENEEECEYIYCDEDTVAEGEECVDPVQYSIDNPPLEENTEENSSCTEETTTEE